jgi:hypothetical protein
MIDDFFTTLFTVSRLVWKTDTFNNRYSEQGIVTTFYGQIQQASAELVQSLALSLTKSYLIWCPLNTNAIEGDTLMTTTQVFSVKAVMDYAIGDNKHKQLVVQLTTEKVPVIVVKDISGIASIEPDGTKQTITGMANIAHSNQDGGGGGLE